MIRQPSGMCWGISSAKKAIRLYMPRAAKRPWRVPRPNELPDLILMDVVMPGLNGFQATRAITQDPATRHIPVIICTTKGQETDKIWGMRQGAKDYITKPIGAEELLSKIAALG
jgi:CheY-like chemotaxis protein